MFDEFESRGDKLDYDKLGELFGMPFVPTYLKPDAALTNSSKLS